MARHYSRTRKRNGSCRSTIHSATSAKCFNLEISAVLTQKPGVEPTAKQLEKIIRVCTNEKEPTRIIAVEPQYSTSNSGESLKKET